MRSENFDAFIESTVLTLRDRTRKTPGQNGLIFLGEERQQPPRTQAADWPSFDGVSGLYFTRLYHWTGKKHSIVRSSSVALSLNAARWLDARDLSRQMRNLWNASKN